MIIQSDLVVSLICWFLAGKVPFFPSGGYSPKLPLKGTTGKQKQNKTSY